MDHHAKFGWLELCQGAKKFDICLIVFAFCLLVCPSRFGMTRFVNAISQSTH